MTIPSRPNSLRWQTHDYAGENAYFVTLCTHDRNPLFSRIVRDRRGDRQVALLPFGEVIKEEWERSFEIRRELVCDGYTVMPDHFHAVFRMLGSRSVDNRDKAHANGPSKRSLGSLMAAFKAVTSRRINEIRKTQGAAVWQRGYFDRVIRDEKEWMTRIQYVMENPSRWKGPVYGEKGWVIEWLDAMKNAA